MGKKKKTITADITKCKYHTFDGGRDLIICTCAQHPCICEQVKDCYYKQLIAAQAELAFYKLRDSKKTDIVDCCKFHQNMCWHVRKLKEELGK